MKYGTCIKGIGAYIPEEVRGNDWWPQEWVAAWKKRPTGVLDRLSAAGIAAEDFIHPYLHEELLKIEGDPFTGLKNRRVAPADMLPSDMEIIVAKEAMANAGVGPDEIDMVTTFSAPPDQIHHPTAFRVHHELGLTNAIAYTTHAVCFSINVMMNIAHQFISQGIYRNALLLTSCKFSNVMDYTTSMSVQAGDGAAGFVLGRCKEDEGILSVYERSVTEFHDVFHGVRRPRVLAPRAPFAYGPDQNQTRVFFSAVKPLGAAKLMARLPYWAEEAGKNALEQAGWRASDVDLLITNAAMVWYARIVARVLDIKTEAIEENTLEFNNMAGTNLPMNLYMAWKKDRLKPGTRVLFFGHGAGGSFGSIALQWPR